MANEEACCTPLDGDAKHSSRESTPPRRLQPRVRRESETEMRRKRETEMRRGRLPEVLHVVFAEHGVADGVPVQTVTLFRSGRDRLGCARRLLLHVVVAVAQQLDQQLHALQRVPNQLLQTEHAQGRRPYICGSASGCLAQQVSARQELRNTSRSSEARSLTSAGTPPSCARESEVHGGAYTAANALLLSRSVGAGLESAPAAL